MTTLSLRIINGLVIHQTLYKCVIIETFRSAKLCAAKMRTSACIFIEADE